MGKAVATSIVDSSRRLDDASVVKSVTLTEEETSKFGVELNAFSDGAVDKTGSVIRSPSKRRTHALRVLANENREIYKYNDGDLDSRHYSVSSRLAEDGDHTASICSNVSVKGNACGNCDLMFCQRDGDASIAHSSELAELRKDINEMKRIIKPSEFSFAESGPRCKEDERDEIWPNFLQCFPTNYIGMCISWNNFQHDGQDEWDNVSEITTNKESFLWNDDYQYKNIADLPSERLPLRNSVARAESSRHRSNSRSRTSYAGSSNKRSGLLSSSIPSNKPKSPLRLGKRDKAQAVKARKVIEGGSVLYEV
ncbi:hypothetical protein ACHAW6_004082 [Cyclotella cf. meneghiniana]